MAVVVEGPGDELVAVAGELWPLAEAGRDAEGLVEPAEPVDEPRGGLSNKHLCLAVEAAFQALTAWPEVSTM